MAYKLLGKVALVTGGASGIGNAIATRFAQEGADLAVIDINGPLLAQQADHWQIWSPSVTTCVADLRDEHVVYESVQEVLRPHGRVDIVVANVGLLLVKEPFENLTLRQWRDTFDLNFFSHIVTLQAAFPFFQQLDGGCVITMCSDQAQHPDAGLSAYAAAKAALLNLTYALAGEWAAHGIRVNALAPGMTRTPLLEANGGLMDMYAQQYHLDDREEAMKVELRRRGVPLGRLGEPEEIAEAALYLATASFCTGSTLRIDGGNVRALTS